MTRTGETLDFPKKACPAGMMVNVRFPTCWDGVNLDSPDHMSHVAYRKFLLFQAALEETREEVEVETD
jgi:hypothetical protein